MRNFRLFAVLAVICVISLLITAPACIKVGGGTKSSSPLLSDATLAGAVDAENRPVGASTNFPVNTNVIYLSVKLNKAPDSTQVMVKLTRDSGWILDLGSTTIYNSTRMGGGDRYMAFSMKPQSGGFPAGNYSVSVSANGAKVYSLPLKVETAAAPQVPATAPGAAGAATSQVPANVPAALPGPSVLPDLTISDVWIDGTMIYYKIKNAGQADSPPTYTNLWVQNLLPAMGSSSFVDVLKPGQEKTLTFSSYDWPYRESTGSWNDCIFGADQGRYLDPICRNQTVKVCADAKDESKEISEANNCKYRIWGTLFDYNLATSAHLATWRTSSGQDPVQGVEGSQSGAYIKMTDGGLEMVPDQVPQGWIQGAWGYFYTDPEFRVARSAAIKVSPGLHFSARVGLAPNATGSDGVTFKLGVRDMSDQTSWLPGKAMTTPGVYENWDIDLKDYVEQKVFFVLRVEAKGSAAGDYAVWKEARLVQVND